LSTQRSTHNLGLTPADRIALVGLGGIVASVATWFAFGCADALLASSLPIVRAIFEPTEPQALVRLAAIVLVLVGTLIIQTLTGQRFRIEERLMVERERLRQMYEHSPECIVLLTPELTVMYANPAARRIFRLQGIEGSPRGLSCSQALWGRSGICDGCLAQQVKDSGRAARRLVKESLPDGEHWFELNLYPTYDESGHLESLVQVARDATQHVEAERTIQRMAFHDPLTDLPNRLLLRDRLTTALAHAKRRNETIAVAYLDLDDFKGVNDGLGHHVGDGVLKVVAERLTRMLREEDTVARLSGDEFTVISRLEHRDGGEALARRIAEALKPEMVVEGHTISVSASLGVAIFPHHGDDEIDLLKNADTAMYRAKEVGRGAYRIYDPEMSESVADRLALEADLRRAIDREEFVLHYQPQVDLRTGRPIGVEALIRWNHPQRGLLAPGVFLDFAERSGYMAEIGPWVTRTACTQMQAWLDAGVDIGRMAINLSAMEFSHYDVAQTVASILEDTKLDPSRLEIEITETTAMHSGDRIVSTLQSLRDMGVRIAIDDFGTGYSSMSYLKRFPVQTLKIAQTFMHDVSADAQSAAIASMLIDLCSELELDVVAEGVESANELEFLRARGCFIVQGYIYSPPVSGADVESLLGRDLEPAA